MFSDFLNMCCIFCEGDDKIDASQFRHLVTVGQVPVNTYKKPEVEWLSEVIWTKLCALENLSIFEVNFFSC